MRRVTSHQEELDSQYERERTWKQERQLDDARKAESASAEELQANVQSAAFLDWK